MLLLLWKCKIGNLKKSMKVPFQILFLLQPYSNILYTTGKEDWV